MWRSCVAAVLYFRGPNDKQPPTKGFPLFLCGSSQLAADQHAAVLAHPSQASPEQDQSWV